MWQRWTNSAETIATAWLHDCREDQGVTDEEIEHLFGMRVSVGVALLSDFEIGNRPARKAAGRERLASAPGWVQTIKVADLISNTASIVMHDPDFAKVYLEEKRVQRLKGATLSELLGDGYWCVVCGRYLPADEDGLIVHDDVPHPNEMDFDDEDKPQ